jgi:hypothetical protein
VVGSKVFAFRSPKKPLSELTASIGLGDGRFRLMRDVRANVKRINPFGSVGVRVFEAASVFGDWTGQDLTLGMSFVPFAGIPFTITPAYADVTHRANDRARFICGVGLGFKFSSFIHRGH